MTIPGSCASKSYCVAARRRGNQTARRHRENATSLHLTKGGFEVKARGLGRVYRRGSVWWVEYWFRGRQYRESARSVERRESVRLLRQRQAELGSGRLIGPDVEQTTFE